MSGVTEKWYNVDEFKHQPMQNKKVNLVSILQGFRFGLWEYKDLTQEIKDDIDAYFEEKKILNEGIVKYKS